jgi:hypothetical protein
MVEVDMSEVNFMWAALQRKHAALIWVLGRTVHRGPSLATPLLIGLGAVFATSSVFANTVLVYLPATSSVAKVEAALKSGLKSAGKLTVFNRFGDFQKAVSDEKPTAVISTDFFERTNPSYKRAASFVHSGATRSSYILLSLDKAWSSGDLGKLRLGMVNEGSKDDLKDDMKTLFGSEISNIKTVSKPDDLFPMLVFKSVDAVMMSPAIYNSLKSQFSTAVNEVRKSAEVGNPGLFLSGSGGDKLKAEFLALSGDALKDLGFSGTKE